MNGAMEAYIVEIHGRHAVALTSDGRFVRVKNQNFEIGQGMRLREVEQSRARRARITAFAAAAASVCLVLFGGFTAAFAPVGVVSLDVNPSIEFTVNVFDRVLAIEGVNEDGTYIVESMDARALRFQPVESAVTQAIVTLREHGYLNEAAENDVVLSVSVPGAAHASALAARLQTSAQRQQNLTVISVNVSKTEVQAAHALGTSAGKLYLIERLGQTVDGETFDEADWIDTPVREIIREIERNQNGQGQQNGQGAGSLQELPWATPAQPESGITADQPSESAPDGHGGRSDATLAPSGSPEETNMP